MKKFTLEELIEIGKGASDDGEYGLNACKEEIKWFLEMCKRHGKEKSLYELLGAYVERTNTRDLIFYATHVYACWQLINGIER